MPEFGKKSEKWGKLAVFEKKVHFFQKKVRIFAARLRKTDSSLTSLRKDNEVKLEDEIKDSL